MRRDLIDAARDAILDVGLRKTTLSDVARRAGVSRMTVYRQYDDLDALVSAVLTRELTQVIEGVRTEIAEVPSARERLVEACTRAVRRMADNEVYRRILDLDPEVLLPLVVERFGSTQRAGMALAAEQVRAGQADGSIRTLDPERAAETIVLTCQSYVFGARLVDEAGLAELRPLLDGYLRV